MAARYYGVAADAEGIANAVTVAGSTTSATFEFVIADTVGEDRKKQDAIVALKSIMAAISDDESFGNV